MRLDAPGWRDTRTGQVYTEFGINFPDGTERWAGEVMGPLYNVDLSTEQGRGEARDLYDRWLTEVGIPPTEATRLMFIKRDVTLTNGKTETV